MRLQSFKRAPNSPSLSESEWSKILRQVSNTLSGHQRVQRYLTETHPNILHEMHLANSATIDVDNIRVVDDSGTAADIVREFLSIVRFTQDRAMERRVALANLRANVSIIVSVLSMLIAAVALLR